MVNFPNGPRDRIALDVRAQLLAFFARQLLAVIQQFMFIPFRKDHGGSNNRPGEASASYFITSGLDKVPRKR
jgi:hypothetical protein